MTKLKSGLLNIFFGALGLILALLIAEISFRFIIERPRLFFGSEAAAHVLYDKSAGWTPVMDGIGYSVEGILLNKSFFRNDKQRVLFLGDSVTAQGFISDAFADIFGKEVNILNGGVYGYDTHQEVTLFEKRSQNTHPDVLILLFHPNDFDVGVAAVTDHRGRTVVANSYGHSIPVIANLFWNLTTYQFTVQSILRTTAFGFSRKEFITNSFQKLRDITKHNGIKLLVVQLPWFKWPEELSTTELERHTIISEVLNQLKICNFDTFNTVELARGRMISVQETIGDVHHPNKAFAKILANIIYEHAFKVSKNTSGERHIAITCNDASHSVL